MLSGSEAQSGVRTAAPARTSVKAASAGNGSCRDQARDLRKGVNAVDRCAMVRAWEPLPYYGFVAEGARRTNGLIARHGDLLVWRRP